MFFSIIYIFLRENHQHILQNYENMAGIACTSLLGYKHFMPESTVAEIEIEQQV